jgi:hypothetical protein
MRDGLRLKIVKEVEARTSSGGWINGSAETPTKPAVNSPMPYTFFHMLAVL